jgi:hypothetical protein
MEGLFSSRPLLCPRSARRVLTKAINPALFCQKAVRAGHRNNFGNIILVIIKIITGALYAVVSGTSR